jgi:predicted lipoprotein
MKRNKTMNKNLQSLALMAAVLLIAYNSVYFRKLDEVKAAGAGFDGAKYAAEFWSDKLIPAMDGGVELGALLPQLQSNPQQAFSAHSHALGIGNIRFFPVRGEALIQEIRENEVVISLENQPNGTELVIATEYIFGNAVRDASGQIDINDFTNTMDLNTVSAELNQLIRSRVIPPFREKVRTGERVRFTGAIELNQKYLDIKRIEIIPVSLRLLSAN